MNKYIQILSVCILLSLVCCGCVKNVVQPRQSAQATAAPSGAGFVASGGAVEEISLTERSRQYSQQIVSGLTSEVWEHFSDSLKQQIPEENLQTSWNGVASGLSGYQGVESVEESSRDGYDVVLVTLRYKDNKGRTIRFDYNEDQTIAGIWFDEVVLGTRKEDDSESTHETSVKIGRDPYTLDAVLSLPEQTAKAPVVILLGDGASLDADGTVGAAGNTPLRDLARALAEEGIASLRYSTRMYLYGQSMKKTPGIYDSYIQDAGYALDYVYNQSRIDRTKIFYLGMGEAGDYMSAIVSAKKNRTAGAILMGAKPLKLQEELYGATDKTVQVDARYFMDVNSTIPLLVLQGEKDFETTMDDFGQWKTLWKGRSHVDYRSFSGLNHYFMKSSGKQDRSDYDSEGTIDADVSSQIIQWIQQLAE